MGSQCRADLEFGIKLHYSYKSVFQNSVYRSTLCKIRKFDKYYKVKNHLLEYHSGVNDICPMCSKIFHRRCHTCIAAPCYMIWNYSINNLGKHHMHAELALFYQIATVLNAILNIPNSPLMTKWHHSDSSKLMFEVQESVQKKTLDANSRSNWFSAGPEDRIDKMKRYKNSQTPAAPCPTICESSRMPQHWKLPSTIAYLGIFFPPFYSRLLSISQKAVARANR